MDMQALECPFTHAHTHTHTYKTHILSQSVQNICARLCNNGNFVQGKWHTLRSSTK